MASRQQVPDISDKKIALWENGGRVLFPFGVEKVPISAKDARPSPGEPPYVVVCPPAKNRGVRGMIGTLCRVIEIEDQKSAILQGIYRTRFVLPKGGARTVRDVRPLPDKNAKGSSSLITAKMRSIVDKLQDLSAALPDLTASFIDGIAEISSPGQFSDILAQQLVLPMEKADALLNELEPIKRLDLLLDHLKSELEIESIRAEMENKTLNDIDKRQREYFLKQQIETIQSELSLGKEPEGSEVFYKAKLEELKAPPAMKESVSKEIHRFFRLAPYSEEAAQLKSFLDLVFDLPWGVESRDNLDLIKVKRLLDKEHFGLQKVKKRILEHLAVSKIGGKQGGRIFCFAGPPGVGKTSLGKAIADSLGRKFVRMSLGGIKDEAEIRGHRRTYIGAMPGRIIQGIRHARTMNPVFLLDEIDKMGSDFRGDPSSALLEALDPVQNSHFVDNYLGFPCDLSKILFITTANVTDSIHPAFLDRLEVLELPSYTEEEKVSIAKRHLLKRIKEATGVKDKISISDKAIVSVIKNYTREAGLRNLERELEKIYRNAALKIAKGKDVEAAMDEKAVKGILGPPPFFSNEMLKKEKVGVATGLAYTEVGGEVLFVEASVLDGGGNLILTGQLGEVMKESAQAALTYIKSKAKELKIDAKSLSKKDFHVHFPEGAIPKDGPSAGITIAVALYSALSRRKVRRNTALTGEITLRGDILPVGGVREKLLAAHRAHLSKVILPSFNRKDTKELPRSVLTDVEIVYVDNIKEVLRHAFEDESVGSK